MYVRWLILLLPLTVLAQELTPAECAAVGMDVTGYEPTGIITGETNDPDHHPLCRRCHENPFGVRVGLGNHRYHIYYSDLSIRAAQVCKAEYEVRVLLPATKKGKPHY